MATTKSNATPETTLPDDNRAGGTGEEIAKYHALIDWIKGKELADGSLRVVEITSDFSGVPLHERLAYSYPQVTSGANGYKDSKGNTVLFS